jgi:Putative Fe-S cluster
VITDDPPTRAELAGRLRARGKERREAIWFRDAEVAEAVDAILFIGLAPNWYPPNYDCGACGYATCAEFLHATKQLRAESAELEFTGPTCNLRDIDLGVCGRLRRPHRVAACDRLPLPNPRRGRRPQARPHQRRTRRRPVAVGHAQGDRVRPPHARDRLRHA